jgi:hypothetical protein
MKQWMVNSELERMVGGSCLDLISITISTFLAVTEEKYEMPHSQGPRFKLRAFPLKDVKNKMVKLYFLTARGGPYGCERSRIPGGVKGGRR